MRLKTALLTALVAATALDGHHVRPVFADGQQGPPDQRAERAAELAADERRLRLAALLQADADQPREREGPADGVGDGARRDAGRRAERPRERGEPAHRQRVHVHERRLGHGLQDRRAQPAARQLRVGGRPRRAARRQRLAHARHRAVGKQSAGQPARRPRDRHQPRQRRNRLGQEDHDEERVRQPGALPDRAARRRRQGAGAERRRRRRHARLGGGPRRQHRQGAVALVHGAEAGRPRQRDVEGRPQRVEDRRRRHLADRLLRSRRRTSTSSAPATRSRSTTRSSARATTCTRTRWWRSTSPPAR